MMPEFVARGSKPNPESPVPGRARGSSQDECLIGEDVLPGNFRDKC